MIILYQFLIFHQCIFVLCNPLENRNEGTSDQFESQPNSFNLGDIQRDVNLNNEDNIHFEESHRDLTANKHTHDDSEMREGNHPIGGNNCTKNGGKCLVSINQTCHSPLEPAKVWCNNEPQSIGCCLDLYDENPCKSSGGRCFNSYNVSDTCQFKVIDNYCETQPFHIKCCLDVGTAKSCEEEGGQCLAYNPSEKFCWVETKLGYFVDNKCDNSQGNSRCCILLNNNATFS